MQTRTRRSFATAGVSLLIGGIATRAIANNESTPSATPSASPEASPMPTGTMEITIENYRFNPPALEILTGTTVTWTNLDIIPHTVTTEDTLLDSGTLIRDATFTHTFTEVGEFPYYCFLHRTMLGTIIVT